MGAADGDDYALLSHIFTGPLAFNWGNLSQVCHSNEILAMPTFTHGDNDRKSRLFYVPSKFWANLILDLVNYEDWAFGVMAYTVAYASKEEFLDATHSPASHNYQVIPAFVSDIHYVIRRIAKLLDPFYL